MRRSCARGGKNHELTLISASKDLGLLKIFSSRSIKSSFVEHMLFDERLCSVAFAYCEFSIFDRLLIESTDRLMLLLCLVSWLNTRYGRPNKIINNSLKTFDRFLN